MTFDSLFSFKYKKPNIYKERWGRGGGNNDDWRGEAIKIKNNKKKNNHNNKWDVGRCKNKIE